MANISIYVWDQLKPPNSNFSSEDFAHGTSTRIYSRAEKTIEFWDSQAVKPSEKST